MDLDELARHCPIDPEAARQVGGQRGSAALVWAILLQHGGAMDATDITDVIAEHRNMQPPSASGIRSGDCACWKPWIMLRSIARAPVCARCGCSKGYRSWGFLHIPRQGIFQKIATKIT